MSIFKKFLPTPMIIDKCTTYNIKPNENKDIIPFVDKAVDTRPMELPIDPKNNISKTFPKASPAGTKELKVFGNAVADTIDSRDDIGRGGKDKNLPTASLTAVITHATVKADNMSSAVKAFSLSPSSLTKLESSRQIESASSQISIDTVSLISFIAGTNFLKCSDRK